MAASVLLPRTLATSRAQGPSSRPPTSQRTAALSNCRLAADLRPLRRCLPQPATLQPSRTPLGRLANEDLRAAAAQGTAPAAAAEG